uniref:Uncharacterized protein n=1 Tax=Chromera velia CCMP2878 TaxID=1169474 RepID=A0A0G4HV26_9ALVE|eukprot:Cvel_32104.t1-p1 / transcript=Cvel_32104.t1 / gene=Cvel_32104 / organism=Chromera_velia_CCMP2878 / gene_product=hypothetical protein / transcript_product=hypothetical protein / location=Cvel_scaffold4916:461-4311(+) / protein_length=313 / sequence_SO=supercontig / SO=protein_coding / is_pseudo=false
MAKMISFITDALGFNRKFALRSLPEKRITTDLGHLLRRPNLNPSELGNLLDWLRVSFQCFKGAYQSLQVLQYSESVLLKYIRGDPLRQRALLAVKEMTDDVQMLSNQQRDAVIASFLQTALCCGNPVETPQSFSDENEVESLKHEQFVSGGTGHDNSAALSETEVMYNSERARRNAMKILNTPKRGQKSGPSTALAEEEQVASAAAAASATRSSVENDLDVRTYEAISQFFMERGMTIYKRVPVPSSAMLVLDMGSPFAACMASLHGFVSQEALRSAAQTELLPKVVPVSNLAKDARSLFFADWKKWKAVVPS